MDSNFIYDKSGLVIGEAGPLLPDFPAHDMRTYRVEEHHGAIARNQFILRYLVLAHLEVIRHEKFS